ncbi:MAG: hypothetical protein HGA26_08850 [Chlorobiaceae bacterium]|nr:hypothetical protein [Chlorobiaceae bacterium]
MRSFLSLTAGLLLVLNSAGLCLAKATPPAEFNDDRNKLIAFMLDSHRGSAPLIR